MSTNNRLKRVLLIILMGILSFALAVSGSIFLDPITDMLISFGLQKNIAADLAGSFAMVLTPSIFLIYYAIRRNKENFKMVMPFSADHFMPKYLISWCVGIVAFVAIWLIANSMNAFNVTNNWHASKIGILLLFMGGYVLQGMSEEIICCGFLQGTISKISGNKVGIIVSVLFFAVFHSFNPGLTPLAFINLLIFATGMSILRFATNNIWLSSGIHSAWNFTQGTITGVMVSGLTPSFSVFTSNPVAGKTLLNGGMFGMEGSLMCTLAFSSLLVGAIIILKKNKKNI
ncbi:CPBP family intramembrane glutamic endopeptidase [Convivina praedatoris]|uniref:CAAX prenyl protease 2/Lysostaphin resistance protein A-like domain-containing protein n=1 Tax=Convivina praedatoris TaxID=2880963 RepID=A0ABN8H8P5_9LACO|nr:type II CAAX endopeptidase family protein [Convivina sp. LMG 32447]CAH1851746.1 hypothetical protein R077815_00391 [Convivina sp. LMG 32447]CAH1853822.1 hypothetical protein LMG032447_00723 [Convivina sp. LMG 32447]CAH1854255.1 hypothetical protein R078138_00839 [Convivina sp. LMG 32447]